MRFVVTFQPASNASGIHSLRAILKIARRRFGLIAIDAREVADNPPEVSREGKPAETVSAKHTTLPTQ
jgi:hypothetical protein